jgi:hypothetical protein
MRCVAEVLQNVCPNCGGNFCPRPVRPARVWKGTANLVEHPASSTIKHRPVDLEAHRALLARIGNLAPEQR